MPPSTCQKMQMHGGCYIRTKGAVSALELAHQDLRLEHDRSSVCSEAFLAAWPAIEKRLFEMGLAGSKHGTLKPQRRIDFSDHDRPAWEREGLGRENAIFQGKVPGTMGRGAARVIQSLRDSDCGVDRLAVWKRECTCTRQVTCSLP
jgi:hypothetical protein